jgi:DNA ligase-4
LKIFSSKIIEVKAYEFVKESDMYSISYTLRFPRVKRIREDKSWHECLDYKGLIAMMNASQQKQSSMTNTAPISSKAAKRKQRKGEALDANGGEVSRKRKAITTLEQFLGVDAASVEVKSDLLKDKEFGKYRLYALL